MQSSLRLCLVFCLILTGIGLGAARGTALIDGRMVLCTGEGVVVTYNADGWPDGHAHICPDMALAMLVATSAPPVLTAPIPTVQAAVPSPRKVAVLANGAPRAAARDPPL